MELRGEGVARRSARARAATMRSSRIVAHAIPEDTIGNLVESKDTGGEDITDVASRVFC